MFEREINRAKERLTKALASAEQYTYWFEINASTALAPFYRGFFEAEVQWWVFEQQMMRSANPRFDYTHERLAYHLYNADHYYVESARFDRQDLTATIDLAVKTRFNYLIRPRTTLRWFVFRGEPTKPLQEVLLRLDYMSGYEYLLNGFRAWAEHKRLSHPPDEFPSELGARQFDAVSQHRAPESPLTPPHIHIPWHYAPQYSARQEIISVVEFDRILRTIDDEYILELSPNQFVELVTPIFELFAEVHGSSSSRSSEAFGAPAKQHPHPTASSALLEAPMAALVVFLDDKGIQPLARELERLLVEEQRQTISQQGLLRVLSDILTRLENVEHESTSSSKPSTPSYHHSSEQSDEESSAQLAEQTPQPSVLGASPSS
jgi:hypothetical protein